MRDVPGPSEITIRIHNHVMKMPTDLHHVVEVALAEDWVPFGYAKRKFLTRYKNKRAEDVTTEQAVRYVIRQCLAKMTYLGSIARGDDGVYRVVRPLKTGKMHEYVKPREELRYDVAVRNVRLSARKWIRTRKNTKYMPHDLRLALEQLAADEFPD